MALSMGLLGAAGFVEPTGSFDLLETQTLGSATSSLTFSSLDTYSSDYRHLQVRWEAGRSGNVDIAPFSVTFNNDTTDSNYWHHNIYSSGTTPISFNNNNRRMSNLGSSGSEFAAGVTDIFDPFSSDKKTTIRTFSGRHNVEAFVAIWGLMWNNTAPLTTLTFAGIGYNLEANSKFSLYGIRAGA